jgi:hypothetical protein
MKKAAHYLDLAEKHKEAILAAKTSSKNRFAGDRNDRSELPPQVAF